MQLIDTRPEYPPYWDDQDDREEWVNNRKNALLESDCDPLELNNIAEFIGNLDASVDAEKAILLRLRKLIAAPTADTEIIRQGALDYWDAQAESAAEREFDDGFTDDEP